MEGKLAYLFVVLFNNFFHILSCCCVCIPGASEYKSTKDAYINVSNMIYACANIKFKHSSKDV